MRWVQFGAVSPVMRMQRNGVAFPEKERPQVEDDDQIANWRRYAKLHTRLFPYLEAADRVYRRTGTADHAPPGARLSRATSARASREDEYLFGPDLLAAPVIEPGATERELYLPPGPLGRLLADAVLPRTARRPAARPRDACSTAGARRRFPRRSRSCRSWCARAPCCRCCRRTSTRSRRTGPGRTRCRCRRAPRPARPDRVPARALARHLLPRREAPLDRAPAPLGPHDPRQAQAALCAAGRAAIRAVLGDGRPTTLCASATAAAPRVLRVTFAARRATATVKAC